MSQALPRIVSRRLRVMVVGHQAGPMVFGAERSLLDVLAALDPTRYRVSCALPDADPGYLNAVSNYTRRIHVFPFRWWSMARPFDQGAVARFVALFRREQVDLVHVNTITLLDPLVAARRLGIPSVLHARELIDRDEVLAGMLGEEPSAIVARMVSAADFVIANSEATHRLFEKPGRSFRLYNCVDVERFDIPNQVEPGTLRIGIISGNEAKKGIERFVQIATLASRLRPELEFLVIGPRNALVESLERELAGRAVPARIRFLGYLADPVEAMSRINVLLSLSVVAESFGRTLAEAMAAGRPVIAYCWGAAPELIRHGTDGFLVPFLDLPRVLDRLGDLAASPTRVVEMGRSGRQRARHLFAPEVFAARLEAIYRTILQTRSVSSP